jgi:hypothetical protein
MKCTICKKPIVLVPSASARAAKFGGMPADYTRLFTEHAECLIRIRNEATFALIKSLIREEK